MDGLISSDNYSQYLWYLLGTIFIAVTVNNIIKLFTVVKRYSYQSNVFKNLPGPKPHWLFGNLGLSKPGEAYVNRRKWAKEYGHVYKLHMGPFYRRVMISDPECIKLVLNNADPKDPFTYGSIKPWLGDGLLISKGKKWSRNRRLLTPSFHFDILKPYQNIFSNSANVMMNKWMKQLKTNPSESVEMFECVSLMTLDSLMRCIFGIEEDFQEKMKQHPYIQAVYQISDSIGVRFRKLLYLSDTIYYLSPYGRQFRKSVKYSQTFSRGLIDSKRKEKLKSGNEHPTRKYVDFLDTLLDCKDVDGNGMTDQEIQDEVETFLFEGHDTTASGISWCLYNLARHPQYQQRCREEIIAIIGDKDELSWNDVGKMPYVTLCIKESMRLHNPVSIIGRQLAKDITLPDGKSIVQGSMVGIDIHTCHYNPEIWPDPDTYDPDRFLPENSKGRHSHAFVGFSAGPRNCIGQHFAMNEMKTVISLVLKNYYLELDSSKPAELHQTLILRSKNGIWLQLKPITD